jgi:hypothetical protein
MSFFIVSNQGAVVIGTVDGGDRPTTALEVNMKLTNNKNNAHQRWDHTSAGGGAPGYHYLVSKLKSNEGKPLIIDIKCGSDNNETPLHVYTQPTLSGEAVNFWQVWGFVPGPAGWFYIVSGYAIAGNAPQAIEIKGGRQGPGIPIQINSLKTSNNDYQLWSFVDADTGDIIRPPGPPPSPGGGGWPAPPIGTGPGPKPM